MLQLVLGTLQQQLSFCEIVFSWVWGVHLPVDTLDPVELEWRVTRWLSMADAKPPSNLGYKSYHTTMIIASTHYSDVIMSAMASQITSPTIVYSTIYSKPRWKKTLKLHVTGLCEGKTTGDRWIPFSKGQLRGKCFHLMTSSCRENGTPQEPIPAWVSVINNHQLAKTYWLIFYWKIFNGYYNWA